MFDLCGLKDIHIFLFNHGFSSNDSRSFKEYLIVTGINEQMRIIEDRKNKKEFYKHGFT